MAVKRYYEDFFVGQKFVSRGRTMTEADIRMYGGATDSVHPLHTDALYAASRPDVGRPIMQGVLTLGAVDAFFAQSVSPEDVPTMHYGYDKIRFIKPVYCNDTIHSEFEITDMEIKNESFGILKLDATTYNQDGQVVLFHKDLLYVGRKPVQ